MFILVSQSFALFGWEISKHAVYSKQCTKFKQEKDVNRLKCNVKFPSPDP